MKYKIELESFEGPMDLLLHLISEAKIDIYDIPINIITDQFLDYINKMEELNLEITSEFLVMAATLIEIKSKMLLPKKTVENGEEEVDPREELISRLIEYKKYRDISDRLKSLESRQAKVYYKPREEIEFEEELELEDMKVDFLLKSISNIIKNRTRAEQKLAINEIQREEYSLDQCMNIVQVKINKEKDFKFTELLSLNTTREEIITFFLSILELAKIKLLTIKQEVDFSDLIIKRREDVDGIN